LANQALNLHYFRKAITVGFFISNGPVPSGYPEGISHQSGIPRLKPVKLDLFNPITGYYEYNPEKLKGL
jgi:hypothetical protein